jgi:hypothetical protein
MPTHVRHKAKTHGRLKPAFSHLLSLAERALLPADKLDYTIRKCVVGVPVEAISDGYRSYTPAAVSPIVAARNNGLVSEVLAAIGGRLRAEYDLAQPVPERLASLLLALEQRSKERGAALQSSA